MESLRHFLWRLDEPLFSRVDFLFLSAAILLRIETVSSISIWFASWAAASIAIAVFSHPSSHKEEVTSPSEGEEG